MWPFNTPLYSETLLVFQGTEKNRDKLRYLFHTSRDRKQNFLRGNFSPNFISLLGNALTINLREASKLFHHTCLTRGSRLNSFLGRSPCCIAYTHDTKSKFTFKKIPIYNSRNMLKQKLSWVRISSSRDRFSPSTHFKYVASVQTVLFSKMLIIIDQIIYRI